MNYLITQSKTQETYGLETITLTKAVESLGNAEVLGCDTETTGLKFLDDTLLMLQIYDGQDNYVIDCQTVDISPLKEIFADKKVKKIFHNAKFDYKFLKANGIQTENVYDTMLAEKVLHCGKFNYGYGLKDLLNRYFDIQMDKTTRNTFVGHKGDFTKHQVLYGLDDTVKLLELRKLQETDAEKMNLMPAIKLENNAVLALADIEFNGMYLDKDAWSKVAVEVKKTVDHIYEELEELVIAGHPEYRENQIDMFGGGKLSTISWDSPKQVLELFKKYDPTLEGVGGPALKGLKQHPIIELYIEYKEQSKKYNAYGPDFYKYLHSDGKVHTNFDQILDTGRVSSKGPNMQQIPADNVYRNAFVPKDPDWRFVTADFSAQELCIIAYGSQDPVWMQALREGKDLHSICAELIFDDKWKSLGKTNDERKETKEGKKLRTHVKAINFGLAYGMSAYGLSAQLDITEKEATALIDKYFITFPKIKGYLEKLSEYGQKFGFIRTYKPFSRVRHFDQWEGAKTPGKIMKKISRMSKNTPIQGTGADMTKLALVMLREIFKDDDRAKMVMTVHDEVNMVCHKDYAEKVAEMLSGTMEKAATFILGEGLLKSEPEITSKWSK